MTGAGQKGFCSGVDLKDLNMGETKSIERKNDLWERIHRVALTLERFDKPMICAVNGSAVGAGMDMALMCDIRFASENARFSEGYIKVGLSLETGVHFFCQES
ncbi:enoyl-CoA hydratase/isomerase family protein [Neobacillus drentensis]